MTEVTCSQEEQYTQMDENKAAMLTLDSRPRECAAQVWAFISGMRAQAALEGRERSA